MRQIFEEAWYDERATFFGTAVEGKNIDRGCTKKTEQQCLSHSA